jgi:hypothetical protein
MANTRRTRAYRGSSKRTSGSSSLMDTVKSTLTGMTGSRGRGSRGRGSRGGGGGGLASQASGFIGGLLSGGNGNGNTNRSRRGRRRR